METTVAGKKIEFGVDEDTGKFKARYNGQEYGHVTLQGLKSALERQIKKKPLNIQVVRIEGLHDEKLDIETGVIVGVHSGNRNLMIKWASEAGATQYHGYRDELFPASVNLKKLRLLHKAWRDADKAMDKFKEDNLFDRHQVIADFEKDSE